MAIIWRCCCNIWLLTTLWLVGSAAAEEQVKKVAYATLLYSEDFLLGVRVLGQSIRETQSKADLLVIVTGLVSTTSVETLKKDGWKVLEVETIINPGQGPTGDKGYPDRFSAVYTKLSIFALTDYDKVVYLDADTIMLRNCDELFTCPGFCATLRHSERFNSGVMVVTPSKERYNDMLSKIKTTKSYTGGDQGFLNEYFENFINARLFESGKIPKDAKMMRLPTSYNADIGLYILNSNRWMISRENISVIHYTLGPFKPWNWWTSWVIADLKTWQTTRYHLGPDARGNMHGVTNSQRLWIRFLSWLPCVIIGGLYYRYVVPHSKNTSTLNGKAEAIPSTSSPPMSHSLMSKVGIPKRFTGSSIAIGYLTLLIPLWLVLVAIPNEIFTSWGWFLTYEWTILLHGLLFSLYLKYCYDTGKKAAVANLPIFKTTHWNNPWNVTLKSFGISVVLMVVCLWMADILGIESFIGKVIVTAFSGFVISVFLTHVYSTLPIRWFAFGRNDGNGRSIGY